MDWALEVPIAILPLSLLVRLVRAVRELESARAGMVREAIVRERLRIDDDLRATVGVGSSGAHGHGLTGLTERVHALSGSVTAAPTGDSGFRLSVDLPRGTDDPRPDRRGHAPHPGGAGRPCCHSKRT